MEEPIWEITVAGEFYGQFHTNVLTGVVNSLLEHHKTGIVIRQKEED